MDSLPLSFVAVLHVSSTTVNTVGLLFILSLVGKTIDQCLRIFLTVTSFPKSITLYLHYYYITYQESLSTSKGTVITFVSMELALFLLTSPVLYLFLLKLVTLSVVCVFTSHQSLSLPLSCSL